MADKSRIALEVHEKTKQAWEDSVEGSAEYGSLSDLIRQSVARELSESEPAQMDTEALDRIAESMSGIEDRIGDMEGRLSELESDTTTPETSLTRTKIFQFLNQAGEPQTAEAIAGNINMPLSEVVENLERLDERTTLLESVEQEGDGRAWNSVGGL